MAKNSQHSTGWPRDRGKCRRSCWTEMRRLACCREWSPYMDAICGMPRRWLTTHVPIARPGRECKVYELRGLTDYELAWKYQKVLVEHAYQTRKKGEDVPDSILILEHPPIFTLGRGATEKNLKFSPNDPQSRHRVVRVERGGEVTWHGPGQLVAYPVLDLNNHKRDLHWYAHALEETVIRALKELNVVGERSDVNTGVWVGLNKVAAIGVTASRWITMHGTALNVNCDMSDFECIVPCGIAAEGRGVVSLRQLGVGMSMEAAREVWLRAFAEVFGSRLTACDPQELDDLLVHYPEIAGSDLRGLYQALTRQASSR